MRANEILDISYSKKPKSVYDRENKETNKDEMKERRKDKRQSPWTHDDYADVSENDKWNYRMAGPFEWRSSFLETQKDTCVIQYAFWRVLKKIQLLNVILKSKKLYKYFKYRK